MLRAKYIRRSVSLLLAVSALGACSKVWIQPDGNLGAQGISKTASSNPANYKSRYAKPIANDQSATSGSERATGTLGTSRIANGSDSLQASAKSSSSTSPGFHIPEWNRSSRRLKHSSGQRLPRSLGKETISSRHANSGELSSSRSLSHGGDAGASSDLKAVTFKPPTSTDYSRSSSPRATLPNLRESSTALKAHNRYVDERADRRASLRREVRARLSDSPSSLLTTPSVPTEAVFSGNRRGRIKEVDEALPPVLDSQVQAKTSTLPQARGYSNSTTNPIPRAEPPAAMAAVSSGLQEPEVITKRVAKASADIPSAKKVERKKVASKSVVVDKLPSKKADTQKIVQKKAPAKKVSLVKQAEAPATRVAPVEPAKAPAKRVALVKPVKAPALPSVGTGVAALEKASVAKASLNKASKEEISAQVNKETTSVEDLAVAKKKFESAKKRAVARAAKAVVPQDRNCKGAEVEAKRARSASSEADRLFYYRRALRLCPLEPGYHLEIGRVYAELGRKEDAEFEFHKALELDPESEEAQDELSLLMMESTNF